MPPSEDKDYLVTETEGHFDDPVIILSKDAKVGGWT